MAFRGTRGAGGRGGGRGGRGGRGRGGAGHSSTASGASTVEASAPEATDGDNDVEMQDITSQENPVSTRQSHPLNTLPSRSGGRFRPKNIRRDAAERARLEEERSRDLALKIQEEQREQKAQERRARRGRGRGDKSQRGFFQRAGTASGPFSQLAQENIKTSASGWGWGSGGVAGSSSQAGAGNQSGSSRYRPRRENDQRVNVDLLSGYTGFDEDGTPLHQLSQSSPSQTNLPVSLLRTHHEETEIMVKTTAELEAEERQSSDDDDLFVSQVAKELIEAGTNNDNEIWHSALKSQTKVKTEPGMEAEAMDVDSIPDASQMKIPPSPESKKKISTIEEATANVKGKLKEKVARDPELKQIAQDMGAQLREFGLAPSANDADKDKEGDGDKKKRLDKDGQMFLFQLPPILPPLVKTTADASGDTATSKNNSGAPTKIKTEDGAETDKKKQQNRFPELPPNGGLIGKLVVRKSGKMEMDWGGRMMDVALGAETHFLTTAMLIEENINLENPEASTGTAYGMGEIANKFVIVPQWGEEEDWDPSLDGIEGLKEA